MIRSKIELDLVKLQVGLALFYPLGDCPKIIIFGKQVHFFGKQVKNHGILGKCTCFPKMVQIILWENVYLLPKKWRYI